MSWSLNRNRSSIHCCAFLAVLAMLCGPASRSEAQKIVPDDPPGGRGAERPLDGSPHAPGRPGALTFGILYGGSLIGIEREYLFHDRLGLLVGAGLLGAEAGGSYHFGDGPRTPYAALGFWNAGLGERSLQLLTATAGKRWTHVAAQLGLGYVLGGRSNVRDGASLGIITSIGITSLR